MTSRTGAGILVCGLNGAGKSTLGKALAEELGYHFIDIEDLYFPKTDPSYLYACPRTREEVEKLLSHEIEAHQKFVLASVRVDDWSAVRAFFRCAVLIDVPKEIRMRRVRDRSFRKFGGRMLPGGDLYEQEEAFFTFVNARAENAVEQWLRTVDCPVIRIDGTRPVAENTGVILKYLNK